MKFSTLVADIRLVIPLFLLNKLKVHPLTSGLYPVALGKSSRQVSLRSDENKVAYHQLLYCQYGEGLLSYKNKTRTVKRGDLVLISPLQKFDYRAKSNSQNSVYWINFSGKLADDFSMRFLMKMEDGLSHCGAQDSVYKDFDTLIQLGSRGYTATNVIHAVHLLQQALSF